MRLARIAHADGVSFVALQTPAVAGQEPEPGGQVCAEIAEHPFGDPTFTGRTWPLADVRVLAPILPTKVLCIGKNYADHAAEMGGEAPPAPLVFMKPSTSVVGPGLPIQRPPDSQRVDYEGELAVVIGVPCRDVPEARARDVVLGYTVANDVTARDLQQSDGQWTRAKGYDSFCPLGPWIETALDPSDVAIRTELDGATVQDSRTSLLLHPVEELIAYVSRVMTLLPGDVLLTGTPAGVGPMVDGQSVSVTIEGIGTLTNPVKDRDGRAERREMTQ